MITVTCGCAHSWTLPTMSASGWSHALQHDLCPACGTVGASRFCSSFADPSIGDVISTLAANGAQPCRVVSWSIMAPQHNSHLSLVTINAEGRGGGAELIAEVDRRRDAITKAWFARTHPVKTDMRRLPLEALTGNVADLMLSIGMGEKPVTDWQAFASQAIAVFRGKGETADG